MSEGYILMLTTIIALTAYAASCFMHLKRLKITRFNNKSLVNDWFTRLLAVYTEGVFYFSSMKLGNQKKNLSL